jgi:hypothetical protein
MVLAAQQAEEARLIIMATQGGRSPERALWGSVADEVVRLAPVPVLLVPKRQQPAWPRRRPLRVLLALANEDVSEPALLLVTRLAAVSPIHLVLATYVGSAPTGQNQTEWRTPSLPAIGRYTLAGGIDTAVFERSGVPSPLAEVAHAAHSDLIVMAAVSRPDAVRALLGAASPDVMCRLSVPLLLTRRAHHDR